MIHGMDQIAMRSPAQTRWNILGWMSHGPASVPALLSKHTNREACTLGGVTDHPRLRDFHKSEQIDALRISAGANGGT